MVCFSFVLLIIQKTTFGANLSQQEISGKVTDASDGSSLPGVNVVVKGTRLGTATNVKGHYQLSVPGSADTLVFSYIGYKSKIITLEGQFIINVKLEPETVIGQQIVIVGYQTERKADLTGAVSVVNTKDIKDASSSDVMVNRFRHILQG